MSTNTVILGGFSICLGFSLLSGKAPPIPPILLTAQAVWAHIETTGLIYCPALAVVTKHREGIHCQVPLDSPSCMTCISFYPFLFLDPPFCCPCTSLFPSLLPNKKLAHNYFSPLVIVLLHSYPNLGFYRAMSCVRGTSSCTLTSHHCRHHLDH